LDFIVLGLPIAELWKMKLNKRKKILVMIMFGVGFLVTIISMLRLQAIIGYGQNPNITWVRVEPGVWVSRPPCATEFEAGTNPSPVQAGTPTLHRMRLHACNSTSSRESALFVLEPIRDAID
jgi:hypothetical protein